ncbi:MAG: beta-hydroxyacyl-ACP dehydratase, partial [Bdellovibrionales bacterium]|nr:beta-hydroxyacyl-ACP dehydratase [Bdellovibrionales bacterium]
MNVSSLLPHRAPMLLIDEIIEWDLESKTLVAAKNIGENEFFLQGHYPDFPIVPGVITCEMIFQAGAALISLLLQNQSIKGSIDSIKGKVPVVTRCNQIKFREMIRPNDTVLLSVALT